MLYHKKHKTLEEGHQKTFGTSRYFITAKDGIRLPLLLGRTRMPI